MYILYGHITYTYLFSIIFNDDCVVCWRPHNATSAANHDLNKQDLRFIILLPAVLRGRTMIHFKNYVSWSD
jgi:hypothetical protein